MKKIFTLFALTLVAAFFLTASSPRAYADTTYDVSFASASAVNGFSGSGVFDVDDAGVIVGITDSTFYLGSLDKGAMNLLPTDPGFATNDNVLDGTPVNVTENGFSFVADGTSYNIYNFATTEGGYAPSGCASGVDCITANAYGQPSTIVDFSAVAAPSAVPEPSSLLLLGTGLVGAAGMLYRRRKVTTSSMAAAA